MKIKTIGYIITGVFLFFLAYINKDKIPMPEELKTFDFIISSGVDIDLNLGDESFSISYISSEESEEENNKSNANKNIFNVKSDTMNNTFEKLQSLTNKSMNDSHLEYLLIGENIDVETCCVCDDPTHYILFTSVLHHESPSFAAIAGKAYRYINSVIAMTVMVIGV